MIFGTYIANFNNQFIEEANKNWKLFWAIIF
jgi:hypothetical protein